MPYNGSDGTYTLSDTIAPATLADANELQAILNDIQTALSTAFCKDGQSVISAQVKGFDGTVGAPGYSFNGDSDTGFYRIGANHTGLAVNGTKIIDIATTGASVTGALSATGAVSGASVSGALTLTDLGIDGATATTSPATTDEAAIYSVGATANRKITLANFFKVISSLTAKTSPATNDVLSIYDTTGAAAKSMAFSDFLTVINQLTTDSSPDATADYVVTYDASASAAKKVLLQNVSLAPKAVGKCTLTVTQVTNTISAVNTSTDVITSTAHGMSSGQLVWTRSGTPPTGMTAGAAYYVGVVTVDTFKIYTTLAGALAVDGTQVDLTAATTGAGLATAVVTVSANTGLASNPFQFTTASTDVSGTITVSSAFSTTGWMPVINWNANSFATDHSAAIYITALSTTVATFALAVPASSSTVTWANLNAAGTRTYYIAFQGYAG